MVDVWDYVIVGGGTAGCVLASRLSASPGKMVLLIEAGQDTPPDSMPADILDPYPLAYANPKYRWPLQGHALSATASKAAPILHARVMGGGSSIMGMIMLRGNPLDYDGWASLGASGWSWADVLPYFRCLENDLDFDGAAHGKAGPTEIRRHRREDWPELARAAGAYAEAHGAPFIADMNADFRDGYGALPIAGTTRHRTSSASAYLTAEVRRRPNLRVLAERVVKGLTWDGSRVTGVRVAAGEGDELIAASEIILSMGAILTPHFLLREGCGDPETLRAAGVQPRCSAPGVGANLQNHAALLTFAHLKRHAVQRRPQRNHNNSMFRYSSSVAGGTPSDMALGVGTRVTWHAIARRLANITPILMAPASRGRVSLGAAVAAPLVEYNLLGNPLDRARLVEGLVRASAFGASPQMRQVIGPLVAASRLANAARFNAQTRWNDARTKLIAAMFDYVPGVGEMAVGSMGEFDLATLLSEPDRLAEFVDRNVTPLAHHAGTCRMGAADDPAAVVDPHGCVNGVQGLRVIDASVMPTVPRANTNLPVLMIAEKLSDDMLGRGPRQS
ncbi:MAG: 5-(Hydroxymethyl)furfural/furfural oxidase [Bradyrhizobium sp.]|nr:5-(Hydroxymethyl)furfural/furfural oxidase [Bradyrhizobium sp.]